MLVIRISSLLQLQTSRSLVALQLYLSCLVLTLNVESTLLGIKLRFVTLVLCANFLVDVPIVNGCILHFVRVELT